MSFTKTTLLGFLIVAYIALAQSAKCIRGKSAHISNLSSILKECGAKYGVAPEKVVAARSSGKLSCIDPCFFACFMKKTGFMDERGFFVAEKARETTKLFLPANADFRRLEFALETCEALNYKEVRDGKQGCQRARMLATCILDNKGFDALP